MIDRWSNPSFSLSLKLFHFYEKYWDRERKREREREKKKWNRKLFSLVLFIEVDYWFLSGCRYFNFNNDKLWLLLLLVRFDWWWELSLIPFWYLFLGCVSFFASDAVLLNGPGAGSATGGRFPRFESTTCLITLNNHQYHHYDPHAPIRDDFSRVEPEFRPEFRQIWMKNWPQPFIFVLPHPPFLLLGALTRNHVQRWTLTSADLTKCPAADRTATLPPPTHERNIEWSKQEEKEEEEEEKSQNINFNI